MRTIAFYSYKGGVGRSLALANIGRYLARLGQQVFVLDLDLEAPGLHYKLMSKPERLLEKPGVVDVVQALALDETPPENLNDFVSLVKISDETGGALRMMGAGRAPSGGYCRQLATLDWHSLFYADDAPGVPLFLDLKERIRKEFNPDFMLIDARTGITEVGGFATSFLADDVVCLMAFNRENLDGLRVVMQSIQSAERPKGSAPVRLLPVVARIPRDLKDGEEARILETVKSHLEAQAEDLESTLTIDEVFVLHSEPSLQVKERVAFAQDDPLEASTLTHDYLLLFKHLIPGEVMKTGLTPAIQEAQALTPATPVLPPTTG